MTAVPHEGRGGDQRALRKSGQGRGCLSGEVTFDLSHKGGKEAVQVEDEQLPRP